MDANGWWSQADAVRVVAAVDATSICYIEQPCATLEECAQVRRTTRRPLILDESLFDAGDIVRARAAGAVDGLRLKLARFGGITPVRKARDLAVVFGFPLTIEDSGGGDVVTAAIAHLAGSIPPKLLLAGYLPSEMAAERIATRHAGGAWTGARACRRRPGSGSTSTRRALGERLLVGRVALRSFALRFPARSANIRACTPRLPSCRARRASSTA